ncbi:MAG TPA: hypothetical protein VMZ27_10120 [Candidatus Saccharimonadales bacterium]|nr:hypothetical protein [Candidatus Saccharimonadales bacterium]
MSISTLYCIVALGASLLLSGCSHPAHASKRAAPEAKPAALRLSSTDAIRVARQTAERAGFRLGDFKEPHATYETKDKAWFVFFHGATARTYFGIFVDDETGATRIYPGTEKHIDHPTSRAEPSLPAPVRSSPSI